MIAAVWYLASVQTLALCIFVWQITTIRQDISRLRNIHDIALDKILKG